VYSSLLKMARLNTVPMAAGLVFIGAYGARGGVQAAGFSLHHGIQLGLCTLLTVVVTTGSMLINDYHDFMRGVDTIQTKPHRPLPRGDIQPHVVKRALKWLYATHLTLICLVDSAALRLWILGSTMLTYLYSQHLKPRTGVKNFVCALIIAMAVGLGGMAVAGFSQGLAAVWPSMTIIGCGIFHREIMMDINDLPGDAMTGVPTVPVLLGRNGAWLVSLVPLVLAAGVAATAALTRRRAMTAAAPIVAMIALSLKCRVDGFKGIGVAIESAPLWLACSLFSLTS